MAKIDICNQALTHIGARLLTDLNDGSEAANRIAVIFDPLRDAALEAHDWNFATKIVSLVALSDADLVPGWEFTYQRPANCVRPRRVYSGVEAGAAEVVPLSQNPVEIEKFREVIAPTSGTGAIVSNLEGAVLEFTYKVSDTSMWSPTFTRYFSHRLAADLARHLSGDKNEAAAQEGKAQVVLDEARRVNKSTGNDKVEVESPLINSRG